MWDKRYDTPEYVYGTDPNDFLREHINYFRDGVVLSLAEGEGRNAVFLAGTARSVTGVDNSRVGLGKAQRLACEKGVMIRTIPADLTAFDPGEEAYSGIVSIFCHLHTRDRIALHQRCIRALKPGGIFLMEGFTKDQIGRGTGGPQDPDMLHSLSELRETFNGLEELCGEELVRQVSEGSHHDGDAAVVRFIARKP